MLAIEHAAFTAQLFKAENQKLMVFSKMFCGTIIQILQTHLKWIFHFQAVLFKTQME